MSVIVRVMSSKGEVNVQRFRAMSTELYVHICEKFPWVSITPTVHKLLGHSWELISENDGHGLGNLDESGLSMQQTYSKIPHFFSTKNITNRQSYRCIKEIMGKYRPHYQFGAPKNSFIL